MTKKMLQVAAIIGATIFIFYAAFPVKPYWKGIYVGQHRDSAYDTLYNLSEYLGSYCVSDLEAWRAGLDDYSRQILDRPSNICIKHENVWFIYAQCFLIGRPCSESIEVKLEDDRVSEIRVFWHFFSLRCRYE